MEKARITFGEGRNNRETFWFGSVDGEEFLPLNQEPFEEHAEFIRENLKVREGDKIHMRATREFLSRRGAVFRPLYEKLGNE